MSEIKAIETEYNGYRFRSRLEARWAVFFDAAKIRYEYEPEGYESDGCRYLPDFYLPDFDIYAEVKADRPNVAEDIRKCMNMIKWGGEIKVIVFLGDIPSQDVVNGGYPHFPTLFYRSDRGVESGWAFFEDTYDDNDKYDGTIISFPSGLCNYPHPFNILSNGEITGIKNDKEYKFNQLSVNSVTDYDDDVKKLYIDFLSERNKGFYYALSKAKQARFEYGERG